MLATTESAVARLAEPPELDLPQHSDLRLHSVLMAVDLGAVCTTLLVVLGLQALVGEPRLDVNAPMMIGGMLLGTPAALAAGGLYQRRKCAIASVEISRVGRVVVIGGLVMLGLLQAGDSTSPYITTSLTVVLSFLTIVLGRGVFRHVLKAARLQGRFLTPVVLVGDRGAASLFAVRLTANTDAGLVPVAHLDLDDSDLVDLTDTGTTLPRIGSVGDDLEQIVDDRVRSAILLTDSVDRADFGEVVRSLQARFEHVQLVTALAGVSHARLVHTPLVGETTFYLESFAASRWQRILKRSVDLVLSSLLLLVLSPVLLAAAIAVKATDGGPVLFSQDRIGLGGRTIPVYKFRSMVVDAEQRLADLADDNQRGGPLFKAAHDPRITRVGRILRASSLDELPQLWSILRGDMSLVGPRPALPAEVAEFDSVHRRRHEVKPGLTGLWQVEDRDHPDFDRYRRHDVFYVENWSLSLDAAIILQTAATVTLRAARSILPTGGSKAGVIE